MAKLEIDLAGGDCRTPVTEEDGVCLAERGIFYAPKPANIRTPPAQAGKPKIFPAPTL